MKRKSILTAALALGLSGPLLLLRAQRNNAADVLLGQGLNQEEVDGDCREAVKTYQKVTSQKNAAREVAARAQLHIGVCQEKLGQREARIAYELLLTRYPDQADVVEEARARMATLGARDKEVRERRIYSGPNFDHGFPSADGRFYTYGAGELTSLDTETGETRRILPAPTSPMEFLSISILSPDNRRIAYHRGKDDGSAELHVANADGTSDRLLFSEPDTVAVPADWSADGRYIAASLFTNTQGQIVLFSAADGMKRVLYTAASRQGFSGTNDIVKFSPDGRFVAFTDRSNVYLVPVAGGAAVAVVDHPATENLIGWAPDGRLVFSSDRSGTVDMWAVRIRDGRPDGEPELTKKNTGDGALGLTRQGEFFYVRRESSTTIYTAELNAAGRVVSEPSPLVGRFTGANRLPDYSRDGKFLAYLSGPANASSVIRIRSLETGQERQLQRPEGRNVVRLRWYPDGKAILVITGNGSFYRVDAETGSSSMLSSGEINAANLTYPAFSPDGAFLYYLNFITREAASSGGLMRLDLATGTREQLYQAAPGDLLRTFSLSPDAARIVLYIRTVNTEDALFLMPSSGGNARRLYAYPKGEFGRAPGALDWTADGGAILFHHAVGPKDELLRVPLNGGAPDKILTTDQVWSLAVHPDGRHLAWESRSTTVEVFVVDNLFAKASR